MKAAAHIQLVPIGNSDSMREIDRAIDLIKSTPLEVEVGAFGTAVEGDLSTIEALVSDLLQMSFGNEFLLNVQYHVGETRLSNYEKVSKHRMPK